jgi:hypothetical protein
VDCKARLVHPGLNKFHVCMDDSILKIHNCFFFNIILWRLYIVPDKSWWNCWKSRKERMIWCNMIECSVFIKDGNMILPLKIAHKMLWEIMSWINESKYSCEYVSCVNIDTHIILIHEVKSMKSHWEWNLID